MADQDSYRAECVSPHMWLCIKGDDWQNAPIYDTEEDAQDAADSMNGLYFADGAPANAAARAKAAA